MNGSGVFLPELFEMMIRTLGCQVFVANPNKSPEVVQILAGNKERLLRYLGDFHTDKGELLCLKCFG